MDLVKASKQLSYVLRHRPDSIGITLAPEGWVEIDVLLDALAANGTRLSKEDLARVVAQNDKQRFAIDGDRIRASQGHSVEVELGYAAAAPPDVLFHGTAERNLASIFDKGLVRGRRHHVHLSAEAETALKVGAPARKTSGADRRRRQNAFRRVPIPRQRERCVAHRSRARRVPSPDITDVILNWNGH